ncbi:MAG: diguanylate cyclase [Gallionellaceae bacterium]|nr:diguanylate cyclase [Gallionellaceae bacterium]
MRSAPAGRPQQPVEHRPGGTGAVEFAERLREQVSAETVEFGGQRLETGVSIGVTTLKHSDATVDAPLARADRALHRAKELGRNRVESA